MQGVLAPDPGLGVPTALALGLLRAAKSAFLCALILAFAAFVGRQGKAQEGSVSAVRAEEELECTFATDGLGVLLPDAVPEATDADADAAFHLVEGAQAREAAECATVWANDPGIELEPVEGFLILGRGFAPPPPRLLAPA